MGIDVGERAGLEITTCRKDGLERVRSCGDWRGSGCSSSDSDDPDESRIVGELGGRLFDNDKESQISSTGGIVSCPKRRE